MSFVMRNFARAVASAALIVIFVSPAAAQELKVGVVSVPVLMEKAPQARIAMDELEQEFQPRQREIVAKQKEYEELTARVQRDIAVMGETERRTADKSLRDMQREVLRLQNEFREDLDLRRNEELGKLQRSLLQEVQAYAQAAGFDIILGDGVLFANPSVNITELVLQSMEAKFKAANNN